MEKSYDITETDLIEGFNNWKSSYIENPDSFTSAMDTEDYGTICADYLLRIIGLKNEDN